MKCKKCGREYRITLHGAECPSCYTVYKLEDEEIEGFYNEAVTDEANRRFSLAAAKYKLLAEENMTEAEFRLAQCKEYGRGTKHDIKGAVELYRKAAKKMLPEACYAIYRVSDNNA